MLTDPAGPYSFSVVGTDSTPLLPLSASQQYSGTTVDPLTVSCSSASGPVEVGLLYANSCTASGGTPPYNWSIGGPSPPPGIAIQQTGDPATISDTPAAAVSSYHFWVSVLDSSNPALTAKTPTFNGAIVPAVSITTSATLAAAVVGEAYGQQFAATAGVTPYTWQATGLPSWLSMSPAGLLGGTPPSPGPASFTVTVTDAAGAIGSGTFTLPVNGALTITNASPLPTASVNVAYRQTFTATGGTGIGYSWSATGLPSWLNLDAGSGVLAGTPPATAVNVNFTVMVTDSAKDTAAAPYTVPITLAITSRSPLPVATIGTAYSETFTAVGGAGGYSWSAASLPSWLTLNSSTGALTGNPPAAPSTTTSAITVTVTDSSKASASAPFTVPVALLITTTSPLANGTLNVPYNQTLAGAGGTPPYAWTVTAGALPGGLNLAAATGIVSGKPSAAGTFQFTVQLADSASSLPVTKPFVITVSNALTITTPSPLPNATVGTAYSETLAASGGAPPYTWSVTAGSLPAPLALNTSSGAITGMPATVGTANFTVTVTDSATNTALQAFTLTTDAALTITTASLANGVLDAPYSQSLAASGGTPPYQWTVSSGTLPAGLGLSLSGALAGTPTATGTANLTIEVQDSNHVVASKAFAITITNALTITTSSPLPNAIVGLAYVDTLGAAGGVPPYTWSVTSGVLPASLTLNAASGAIGGIPAATGTSSFTITVTDSSNTKANRAFTLTTVETLAVTTASLPNGEPGANYSATLAAAGGAPPYQWTVASGSLPTGLTLTTAGAIAGTLSTTTTAPFTVQVQDSAGHTATKTFTIAILAAPVISTVSPLPSAESSVPYSTTLAATGGTPPYTWSVVGGPLPGGLTLSAGGVISGTPNAAGSFSVTVQVKDAGSAVVTKGFPLTVLPALAISTPVGLNGGSLNTSYSVNLAAFNGLAPYRWSLTGGSLPGGLLLSSAGAITGTPGATGTFSFTATVTDALGATASRGFTIMIVNGLAVSSPAILPGAMVGKSYTDTLAVSGGTAPYTWTISAGSLPPGLSFSGDTIAGTPTATGNYAFTALVLDSAGRQASQALTLAVAPTLTIVTGALPAGLLRAPYSQTLDATGGTRPYFWAIAAGTFPNGLALSGAGSLTGTPSAAGTFSFTVQVSDLEGFTAAAQFTISVSSITITPVTLPAGSVNTPYAQTLVAGGGKPPYSWTLTSGALPAGLHLSSSGTIAGTPPNAGTSTFTVSVTDSASIQASLPFTLLIQAGLTITTTSLETGQAGTPYSQALVVSGGTPPYTLATTAGTLPPGITLSGATLGGTPTTPGSYGFTIQVTDSLLATASQTFTLSVAGLVIMTSASLPAAAEGTAYSQTLIAAGMAPYAWSIVGGALPAGLSLAGSSGTIQGTPTSSGTFHVTVNVTDGTKATRSRVFTLIVLTAGFTGISSSAEAAQQLTGALLPGAAYPDEITGQITLSFQPDASLASPAEDPAIQFSSGGRTVPFTIPANSTAPISFSLQTGTVAGTLTVAVRWQAGGASLAVPAALSQAIRIAPAVPVISTITASATASGFQVQITAYSNTREVTQAVFQFTPAAGQNLQTTSVTVPLTDAANTWFQSSTADAYGSQFVLTVPFSLAGSSSAIGSVAVELVNTQGTSGSVSATL
jgi:hypothetical protein